MPRYNVQHPTTKAWRCFSSIVDDWITDWMDEETYQKWRKQQYGVLLAGDLRYTNQLPLDEANRRISERRMLEDGDWK